MYLLSFQFHLALARERAVFKCFTRRNVQCLTLKVCLRGPDTVGVREAERLKAQLDHELSCLCSAGDAGMAGSVIEVARSVGARVLRCKDAFDHPCQQARRRHQKMDSFS